MLPIISAGQLTTVTMDHRVAAGVALGPSPGPIARGISPVQPCADTGLKGWTLLCLMAYRRFPSTYAMVTNEHRRNPWFAARANAK